MSSFEHFDNKNKGILILREGPTQGLDDLTLTAKAIYPINFAQTNKRCVLSLLMKAAASYLLMIQKYISSKKITQKPKIIRCV